MKMELLHSTALWRSLLSREEFEKDVQYHEAASKYEEVARLLKVTAPIRIDVRRFQQEGKFAFFDVDMKPVSPILHFFAKAWSLENNDNSPE